MLRAGKIWPHKECISRIGPCAEEITPFETFDALRPFAPSGMTAQLEHDENDDGHISYRAPLIKLHFIFFRCTFRKPKLKLKKSKFRLGS
jgi:hypothetical protein